MSNGSSAALTAEEATALQRRWRSRVRLRGDRLNPPTATGVDIGYDTASDLLVAAAVTIDLTTLETLESATATGAAAFDYVPGLLGFREVPMLESVIAKLTDPPRLLVCDGHGLAHPRRFGSACHLGVSMGTPAIGVAKNPPPFEVRPPNPPRGAVAAIRDDEGEVGRALRTQTGVRPVYVSVGHDIGLDEACDLVLALSPRYRLPETTRRSDRLGRRLLARISANPRSASFREDTV